LSNHLLSYIVRVINDFLGRKGLQLIPIKVMKKDSEFDLAEDVISSFEKNNQRIKDSDILVLSSKYISISERRFINLKDVVPSKEADELARKFSLDKRLAQVVIDESEDILGGIPHYVLSVAAGSLAPNAGVDRSNFYTGFVTLYPKDPFKSAENLRRQIRERIAKNVGVVVSDSRLQPMRLGTTGIAIGTAGIDPVKDERGRKDLFGNTLKVTRRNLADDLCSAAQILMGEADERIPIVDVRDSGIPLTEKKATLKDLSIRKEECLYVRGLRSGVSSSACHTDFLDFQSKILR
jgi:coenzyme F420-0:L-glutamate ligase/coenzyme F420-1:gamma-L-glutamate ligase